MNRVNSRNDFAMMIAPYKNIGGIRNHHKCFADDSKMYTEITDIADAIRLRKLRTKFHVCQVSCIFAYLHIFLNAIEHHCDYCTQTLRDSTSPSSDFMSAEDINHAVRHISVVDASFY